MWWKANQNRALIGRDVVLFSTVAALLLVSPACHKDNTNRLSRTAAVPSRNINAVLRAHDKELMAIPGVVGVYVGLASDGKSQCLRVMAAKRTPALERQIPKSFEGYPVELDETGVIRPLGGK